MTSIKELKTYNFCSIRDCANLAESLVVLKLPFCFLHEKVMIEAVNNYLEKLVSK